MSKPYCAVYDFELMPYALGDVLTWNIHTAVRCEEWALDRVDIYMCVDRRFPASIYQKDSVSAENCELFFSEVMGAFGTHPKLGNLLIFRQREHLLAALREAAKDNPAAQETLADYCAILEKRGDENALIEYFMKGVYYHGRINSFAAKNGRIPLLRPSVGCEPDVAGLLARRFPDKRVVFIHPRLRRLDVGSGGRISHARDSDFLEWYEFLRQAGEQHPEVQFVAVGRLQEKPLELLRLPNVSNLRVFGFGLGHELSLLMRSELFIGASSGFAATANFSTVPYFIMDVTPASCRAYGIEMGTPRLPFAAPRQVLVYEPESRDLLMRLLEEGLAHEPPPSGPPAPQSDPRIDVRSWEWESSRWLYPDATTNRFFNDASFADKETAFLVWPRLREAQAAWRAGDADAAIALLARLEQNFPRLCAKFPEFLRLRREIATAADDAEAVHRCDAALGQLAAKSGGWLRRLKRLLARSYPAAMWLKYYWGESTASLPGWRDWCGSSLRGNAVRWPRPI